MAAMLRSSAVLRSLVAVRRSSTLRQPLHRRPLSQRVPEPMEFISEHWEDLTPAANAPKKRAAVKVEGKEEETESQKWERVRMLIQKHLEENPMPMSPVRAYYVLWRDLFEIMEEKDAPKLKEKRLRPRKPGEKHDLPSGRGRRRLGAAGAPKETKSSSGRRSAKQSSKLALALQRLQSQQSSGTEAVAIKPEEAAADKSQDPALKEAAETKPEEKAADKSQDPVLKEAAETKPEEKAADKSQDPALKEAAQTKPEDKAADKSQDPALKEAAETKPEEKAADKSQDPALKEAAETKPEEKAADKSQDPALKEAAKTKPEETAADKSQDPALKEAAETKPEEKAVDKSQALALKDTDAKSQGVGVKKGPAGRTARRQQAATRKVMLQGDYAKFNEFVLDRLGKANPDGSIFSDFIRVYQEERYRKRQRGLRDRLKRKNVRKSFGTLNRGYEEPEEEYEAEEEEFKDEWREKSILEDYWKAEKYHELHQRLRKDLPEREQLAAERTDRVADVLRSAFCKEYADQHRPVLTHELADYENPYMLKRSAMERLLHERCVRNQLDERVMPRLLDQHPELVKLRRQAALPPETLEPLAAFRGDVRWHFDARERLEQKLQGVDQVLQVIVENENANVDQLRAALPEKRAENPPENQLEGVRHPWRNHLGFESAVPRGVAGGTKFGQPEPELATQLAKMRYPTLQRVAHTLPKDPKYRAHVVRSIRVLERSKDWDFQSKLDAINRMKEIYDTMKDSQEYMSGLDEKLVVNRVPSHIKRKYAKDVQYVKHYPKMWYKNKSFFRYRPSLTATAPLGKKKK